MIHLALDLAHATFTDSNRKYAATDFGSLVATVRVKKLVFTGAIGDKLTRVTLVNTPRADTSGFAWSGGLRYDLASYARMVLTFGAEPGASVITGTYSASEQHYVRLETVIQLL